MQPEQPSAPHPVFHLPAWLGFNAQSPEPIWLKVVIDLIVGFIAFGLAWFLRYQVQLIRPVLEVFQSPFSLYLPYVALFLVWIIVQYSGAGLYRRARTRSFIGELTMLFNGITNATLVLMAISFMTQARGFSRLMLVYLVVVSTVLLGLVRIIRRIIYAQWRKRGIGVQRTLIVGVGDAGQAVLRVMLARRSLGFAPMGYLDDDPEKSHSTLGRVRGLGTLGELPHILTTESVDLVVVTLPWTHHNRIMHIVETCQRAQVAVRVVPDVFQLSLSRVSFENLDGIPLLGIEASPSLSGAKRVLKRALDLSIVTLTAPLWVVVMVAVAVAIRLDGTGGGVFYNAERVGENGKRFKMMKFRSMIPNADQMKAQLIAQHGGDPKFFKLEDDPRITPVGKFIRKTSLDELPNLFNVIRGEMSLVGTRPPTPDEVALYADWHYQRLKTIPGITGLWQVSGRSEVPFDEVVLLDIYYIENWTIRLDIEILLRTIPHVLMREGAY